MPKRSGPRGRTMPVPAWWIERINAAIPKGVTHPEIARMVEDLTGWKADPSSITRCLNGKQPTLELVLPLSDLFRVPRPFFIARTPQEAVALAGVAAIADARKEEILREIDAKASVLKAVVPDRSPENQTVPVDTEHEDSASGRGARSRGRKQR